MKELFTLTTVTIEIAKRQFLIYLSNGCYGWEKVYQKPESYRFKLSLKKLFDWVGARWGKILQRQKFRFLEKGHES